MEEQPDESRGEERRRANRRERHPWLAEWRRVARGRREQLRRAADRRSAGGVIDRFRPEIIGLCVAVCVLSATDAALTLALVGHGIGAEANPVMAWLLGLGVDVFIGAKVLVTGVGMVLLVAYSELMLFGRYRLASAIHLVLACYVALVAYELTLLLRYT